MIFCPFPLADGVTTITGSPLKILTRSVSIRAFITNAEPVSRWHQVQWQQFTNIGLVISR
jgi:hypothetical protein